MLAAERAAAAAVLKLERTQASLAALQWALVLASGVTLCATYYAARAAAISRLPASWRNPDSGDRSPAQVTRRDYLGALTSEMTTLSRSLAATAERTSRSVLSSVGL